MATAPKSVTRFHSNENVFPVKSNAPCGPVKPGDEKRTSFPEKTASFQQGVEPARNLMPPSPGLPVVFARTTVLFVIR
jgi:hypothetical protein